MDEREVDVMVVPEHWRGEDERVRRSLGLKETEEEKEKRKGLFGDGKEWYEVCRRKGSRGGVGVIVRSELGEVEVLKKYSKEGMIWIAIKLGGGKRLVVGGVYCAGGVGL